jgi:acyl phosphate:glycerol-3-phosphate acyltransferase
VEQAHNNLMLTLYLIVAINGYLLGSIPFGFVLVKLFRGEDVRSTGSGNIGATNVARTGSKGLAVATLALDTLKGMAAVAVAAAIARSSYNSCGQSECVESIRLMSAAALAAVFGHMFPVWLKFKGGKGVATALGVFLVLFPKAVLVSLAIFIIVVAVTRYVSLGSILAAIAFPVAAYFLGSSDWEALLPVCVISLMIVLKHHANVRRLLAGNENRFGSPKTAAPEEQA